MKKKITTIGWLIAGNLCYSAALDFFLVGNEIAAGGFAGIATLINHYISVPIGSAVFIMNLPLIIWAWKSKGKDYALNCITGNILFTIIADLLSIAPTLTHIKWIAAVFGGIIYGIGITFMTAKAASILMPQLKECPHPCPISGRASYSHITAILGLSEGLYARNAYGS